MDIKHTKPKSYHFNTPQVLFIGFLTAIIIGSVLLCLPISSATGEFTPYVDALFTSTTSVCVTGLTVVSTAAHWSIFGKIVILCLIQLGGLGVVCFAMGIFIIIGKKITIKERMLIQQTYNLDSLQGLVKLVKRIIKGTLCVELLGAAFYSIQFIPEYGVIKGLCYSIFHAVSAFCNAGLDLLGDTSFVKYQSNILVNGVTIFLIVAGGIGFTVWWDIARVHKTMKENRVKKGFFSRLSLHSKLAIVTTAVLLIGGAILIFALEYCNNKTIGDMSFFDKIQVSLFESVTTRTAGFATVFQENFKDATTMILLVFMMIGGSPMGTAGGIKTTTIAMIIICIKSTLAGKRDNEAYGRKISPENIKTGLAVGGIFVTCLFIGIILLSITQNISLKDIVFEATSAIATVGLTRGATAQLDVIGKIIVTLLMFLGRIGPITMAMAFSIKRSNVTTHLRELPEKNILVG